MVLGQTLRMLKNYFKIAWRNIVRHKGFTLINVLGLSAGICASLVIYLITSFELSYDRTREDGDRIYRIVANQRGDQGKVGYIGSVSNPLPMALRKELTGFERVTEFHNYFARVTVPNGSHAPKIFDPAKRGEEASPIIIAEPQYFDIFRYKWLEGNPATALGEPYRVVLSESEAYKYFGSQPLGRIIGRQVFYKDIYANDSLQLTVAGIVGDWDGHTDLGFKDFISFSTIEHSWLKEMIHMDNWGNWNPNAQGFVKLAKGVDAAQVERQFSGFVAAHVPPYPGWHTSLLLQPLKDIHFNSDYRDTYSRHAHLPTLYALMGIAAFILLIAAVNFINLSTAQSLQRAKEIGVRKVLGGSKGSLRVQFLVETFLVTAAATVLAIVLAGPALHFSRQFIPVGVSLNLSDPATVGFLLLITVGTALLAGYYPAKVLSSYAPVLNLKGSGARGADKSGYLRRALIVFQFTISLSFIIGALVIGNQIRYIQNKDLGFKKDEIITLRTGWGDPVDHVRLLAERLREMPAVGAVSTHLETPAAKGHSNTWLKRLDEPEFKVGADYEMCDENYVPLYGLKIAAGRNIVHSDTVREFLVNETAAAGLGFKRIGDAIGKPVQTGMNDGKGYIVGVVKDFHSRSLHDLITPFFISSDIRSERAVSVRLAAAGLGAGQFGAVLARIEKVWKGIYPDEKFEYRFFDETVAGLYADEKATAGLMNTAVVVAIFICSMGLFGLATFSAQRRTKEIGIRKILGASVVNIASMLSIEFLKLVGLAILIASPVAYYFSHRWLNDFAYRAPVSGWVFVIAGVSAVGIALLTVSYQAIRAATANPVKSLRTE